MFDAFCCSQYSKLCIIDDKAHVISFFFCQTNLVHYINVIKFFMTTTHNFVFLIAMHKHLCTATCNFPLIDLMIKHNYKMKQIFVVLNMKTVMFKVLIFIEN